MWIYVDWVRQCKSLKVNEFSNLLSSRKRNRQAERVVQV